MQWSQMTRNGNLWSYGQKVSLLLNCSFQVFVIERRLWITQLSTSWRELLALLESKPRWRMSLSVSQSQSDYKCLETEAGTGQGGCLIRSYAWDRCVSDCQPVFPTWDCAPHGDNPFSSFVLKKKWLECGILNIVGVQVGKRIVRTTLHTKRLYLK